MFCPNCETENAEEARFCEECGFPLSGALSRPGGAASPSGSSALEARAHEEDGNRRHGDLEANPERKAFSPKEASPDDEFEQSPFARRQPENRPDEDAAEDAYGDSKRDELAHALHTQTAGAQRYPNEERPGVFSDEDPTDGYSPTAGRDAFQDTRWQGEHDFEWPDDASFEQRAFQNGEAQPSFSSSETAPLDADFWRRQSTMQMPRMPQAPQDYLPANRDYRAYNVRRGPSRKAIAIGVAAALALVVAALLAAGFALGVIGGKPVPDVTGMTEADARAALESEGFAVRSTKVKSDGTEGLVLIMDPGAGSRAPQGSEVVIHIATARFVPEIVGKTRDEAAALLGEAGYENVKYATQRSDGPENIVLEVSPEAGTRAKGSTEVLVTVSEAYKVPDVSDLSLEEAIEAIEAAGLVAEVVYIDTDQFPDGSIIGTNPEAGTRVSQGDVVGVSVARLRGIELVALTEELFSQGSTVTVGGIDYQIESVISMSYQGDDAVAFTATGKPYVTFFGERLFASASQTISGTVTWTADNEVASIS